MATAVMTPRRAELDTYDGSASPTASAARAAALAVASPEDKPRTAEYLAPTLASLRAQEVHLASLDLFKTNVQASAASQLPPSAPQKSAAEEAEEPRIIMWESEKVAMQMQKQQEEQGKKPEREIVTASRKERLVREKARDKLGAAQALHNIATIHLSREEPKEAARAAEAAKSIYKKAQDILGQVESLALVAQAHMFMVSKLDATEELQEGPVKENKLNIAGSRAYVATEEAMEVIKDCRDEKAIATANLSRAEVLSLFGETRDSVSAARRACDGFRRRGDKQSLAMALMLSARGFLELGTAGLAEKSAEEALYLFTNMRDEEGVAAAEELLNEIGPSGMAISGTANYEIEAPAGPTPASGAASEAGAVAQKGPDAAQVKEMIRKEVESILGSSDEVANDTPLMDTGLDSLSAVQFRNDLTRDFNVKLPASLMFDYPTITALTEKIVQSLEEG